MAKQKVLVILKGEGINQHELHADTIERDEKVKELSEIRVGRNGFLRHVDPVGNPGDHNTIEMEEGTYVVGRQVEFNPFTQNISGVFD